MTLVEFEKAIKRLEDITDEARRCKYNAVCMFSDLLNSDGRMIGSMHLEERDKLDEAIRSSNIYHEYAQKYETEHKKLKDAMLADGVSRWFVDTILKDYDVFTRFYEKKY